MVRSQGELASAAERWVLSATEAIQPWDRADWTSAAPEAVSTRVAKARRQVLTETLGHQPAPLAILDCIEQGLPLPFDDAIRTEMSLFSKLIQRREPRNMIQTLFVGKLDYERGVKAGSLSGTIERAIAALSQASREAIIRGGASLAAAGFVVAEGERPGPVQEVVGQGYWIDGGDDDPRRAVAREILAPLVGPDGCREALRGFRGREPSRLPRLSRWAYRFRGIALTASAPKRRVARA
jgi:3-hydroxyacyl-CoA dehydrogenase/enoyl-CoA hydratase/3-hydroxybutyryl-CoA epimerase